MRGAYQRADVTPSEDLLARSLALHVARHCARLARRPILPDDTLIRRYLAARPTVADGATHDLIVVVAPRAISAAIVAQIRALGPAVVPAERSDGR